MKREQLAHILRASCVVADDNDVLVIGSQAILGFYDDDELPQSVLMSMEADIAFLDDPDRRKADEVEGAIGEMSTFHANNQVYAEGVHIDTAELPAGWRRRLVTWDLKSSAPANPSFLEPHDLGAYRLRTSSSLKTLRHKATSNVDMAPIGVGSDRRDQRGR